MHWKVKAHGMALLSRLYKGRQVYHTLQGWAGTNRLDVEESLGRTLEIVALLRQYGLGIEGKKGLEIGTGWRPFLPLVLSLLGAERVTTLDVNPWLNEVYARETLHALQDRLPTIAVKCGADLGLVQQRYRDTRGSSQSLAELLAGLRVDYHCPADAQATDLPDSSVDYVCSSNVLEHVEPDVLGRIHVESFRILRPGGLVVHRFNPGDHFANVDKRISTVNFLRYSERGWHWYGGSGLSYHNRLRCRQHRSMLEAAGFSILLDRTRIDQRALEAIACGDASIHRDFAGFTPNELAADYMWLVGKKLQWNQCRQSP